MNSLLRSLFSNAGIKTPRLDAEERKARESKIVPKTEIITQRKLDHRTGSEGPAHDPYGWDEIIVTLNGTKHTLRHGALGYVRYYRDEKLIAEGHGAFMKQKSTIPGVVAKWENATGIKEDDFIELYYRAHPHFDDPYGRLADYA